MQVIYLKMTPMLKNVCPISTFITFGKHIWGTLSHRKHICNTKRVNILFKGAKSIKWRSFDRCFGSLECTKLSVTLLTPWLIPITLSRKKSKHFLSFNMMVNRHKSFVGWHPLPCANDLGIPWSAPTHNFGNLLIQCFCTCAYFLRKIDFSLVVYTWQVVPLPHLSRQCLWQRPVRTLINVSYIIRMVVCCRLQFDCWLSGVGRACEQAKKVSDWISGNNTYRSLLLW